MIQINAADPPALQICTLFHEWTHARYHFSSERPQRPIRELEAEATAYVLCTLLELEAKLVSAEYLMGYQITPVLLMGVLKQVTQAVREIGEAIGLARDMALS